MGRQNQRTQFCRFVVRPNVDIEMLFLLSIFDLTALAVDCMVSRSVVQLKIWWRVWNGVKCWKSNNTNARLMAFAPSLDLDPTFGIHSHKTLDTAQPCQLLKPNWKPSSSHSISILTNISTQFLLQSVCVCVCAFVRACVRVCVCVCVCGALLYVNCFGRTMLYMCIEYHI